tara:strand:- start:2277 stop:2444 length:168 start_codon:yes stop_codon:yes gene_type:complete
MAIPTKKNNIFLIKLVSWVCTFGEDVCEEKGLWDMPKKLFTDVTKSFPCLPNIFK